MSARSTSDIFKDPRRRQLTKSKREERGEGEEEKRRMNRARKKQGPTSQDPSRRAPQVIQKDTSPRGEGTHPRLKARYFTLTGPLPLLASKYVPDNSPVQSLNSSLWKPDTTCLQWLDQKEEGSVIYINCGIITTMTEQHLIEFAQGLANSMQPFLWVRHDVTMGDSATLPQDFLDEIKDRGLLINYILEGVPLICWPFFSDQQTNCRDACVEWGIGMEINHDVKRNEVEVLVKEMLQGKKGKEMRRNAKEWKRKAKEAIEVGGSSYNNFQQFIKEALLSGDVSHD
ncbi:linamarin synthase 2-like protein [Tanacetum coccineum]